MTPSARAVPYTAPTIVRATVADGRWDRYVQQHPEASQYHQSGWLQVITRSFGHEVCCLAAESPHGLVGVLPLVVFRSRLFGRFVVSLPFVNYGGVLADSPAIEAALLDEAAAQVERVGASYLELRHTRQRFPALPSKRHKVAMHLALAATVDDQWTALDRKVRNQIRKAEKNELRTEQGGLDRLADFYTVFARNMRDLGTPVYGRLFFSEVLSTFPETSRVFCVFLGERPIAASVVCWRGDTIEVPWASAVRDFNSLCANVLLYWQMIRFAIERGFKTFDFGRSTPDEGTFHFKRQWGAEAQPLVWEYWLPQGQVLPNLTTKNTKFSRAIAMWQRLPVPVASVLGPRIVRNIP